MKYKKGKTKKRQYRKKHNTRKNKKNEKKGGWGWFGKKAEPQLQVRNWDGEIEEDNEYYKPTLVKTPVEKYDPFDEKEKQKIIDAYSKVGIEHKRENATNEQTNIDATKLLMNYKNTSSCLEYDSYVKSRINDPNLKNYKKVLDIKIDNLKNNPKTKPYKSDIEGLIKCASLYRDFMPFKPTTATIAQEQLIKEANKVEEGWKSSGGKKRRNKRKTRRR